MEKEYAVCPVCGEKGEMINLYTFQGEQRCLHFFTAPRTQRKSGKARESLATAHMAPCRGSA